MDGNARMMLSALSVSHLRVLIGWLWSVSSCLSKNGDDSLWTKLSRILCFVSVP